MVTTAEPTIRCPNCQVEIALTEAMAGPLLAAERQRHESALTTLRQDISTRETALAIDRSNLDITVANRAKKEAEAEIESQRKEILNTAAIDIKRATQQAEAARADATTMAGKLAEAQQAQAEAVRKSLELDNARRELELTIAKRVSEESNRLRIGIRDEINAENKLKLAERDLTISQLTERIDELKQKAEQGSQQLQGEVQELELERELAAAFPIDTVEPIGKGIHGADCLQLVTTIGGVAGGILWESKRTKNWGGDWLAKLRDDLRANRRADVAVLVSRVLPDEVKTFGLVEGVWVTAPAYAVPLAVAIRATLTGLAAVRAAQAGQAEKAVLVYRYLTGPGFRARIEAVVERFTEMREDLDRERKFLSKQLAKREEALGQVVASMSGLYGDLQGIAGRDVAELPAPFLEEK